MKILYLGDFVARTGFGTVNTNIVRELRKHYGADLQLDIVAINYFGAPYYEDVNTFVVSGRKEDVKDDPFARYFFLKMLADSDCYDGIFICQDLGVIVPIIEVLKHIKSEKKTQNKKSFKSIFYFPVDCRIVPELVKDLEFFDKLVTYTEYGKNEIKRLRPELKVDIVPHGNNSKDFYPLGAADIENFRQDYFGDNADKFIITNVSRNQPRKDIPNTIFGFIEAKAAWDKRLPEPFLYLHMHPQDPLGWDIRAIMLQTDLVENVDYKLISKEHEAELVPVDVLNNIYNASDVIVTTTLGEGWGLLYNEAASCKVPIIAPYVTSFIEMSNYGKNAYMLETIYPYCNTIDNIIRGQTDIFEVAEQMMHVAMAKHGLYATIYEHALLSKKIDANYEWAKKLEWSEVCKRWIDYFKIY